MRILGVRVSPSVASFIVYCTESKGLVCSDVIKIPNTLDVPEKLKYVRNSILDILNYYNVDVASIRVTEANAENKSIDRLYIEAVIQEAFSSSDVKKYFTIRKAGIKSGLGIKEDEYKKILTSKSSLREIDNSSYSQETNEAVMAAIAVEGKF
ncbi:hypothetical protein VP018_000670 [Morganella morganii]|uniref:hypothetical protein n=1 Tax=Morganellaceae TaxID=1903414 RepID=UPI000F5C0BD9|nr:MULTISPECIES: hypothetical protein [Morganellaceae]EMD0828899.1 hypothetical protein [Morganella morganii]MBS3837593.1 hypothetical protein [Proteus mirabilis]RQW16548.1 hypothetical protein EHQ54_05715 [Proteus mirabilis]RTY32914.1 hypothetical protein EKS33_07630 [Morganella morganii subsp. morganii]HEI8863140.1 hypothetical protein [Morganella morganii]